VVVGLSPAFAVTVWKTLGGATVAEALRQLLAGIEEEGVASRVVRVARFARRRQRRLDRGRLSGSLVGIGLQGKGTAVIHRADLPLLANLELYSNAALVDAGRYRALGRNAARYARGANPEPVLLPESSSRSGRATTRASWHWWPRSAARASPATRWRWSVMADVELTTYRCGRGATPSCRAVARSRRSRSTPSRGRSGRTSLEPRALLRQAASPSRPATRSSPTTCAGARSWWRFGDDELLQLYEPAPAGARSSALELDAARGRGSRGGDAARPWCARRGPRTCGAGLIT
jgi:hypothetical protein